MSRFVVLGKHEPTLPTFLFGMDVLTGDLDAVKVSRSTVTFDIAPEIVYESRWQDEAQPEIDAVFSNVFKE